MEPLLKIILPYQRDHDNKRNGVVMCKCARFVIHVHIQVAIKILSKEKCVVVFNFQYSLEERNRGRHFVVVFECGKTPSLPSALPPPPPLPPTRYRTPDGIY